VTALRFLATLACRLLTVPSGIYLDRAVRRLHDLDDQEN
jgi:hypothetical protein